MLGKFYVNYMKKKIIINYMWSYQDLFLSVFTYRLSGSHSEDGPTMHDSSRGIKVLTNLT